MGSKNVSQHIFFQAKSGYIKLVNHTYEKEENSGNYIHEVFQIFWENILGL